MKIVEIKPGEGIKYPKLVNFVQRHGREAFGLDDKKLDDLLDYFLSIKRLFLLKDKKGRIIGLACCNNIDQINFMTDNTWPLESPDGKILYVWGIVIHRALRHNDIMGEMLRQWLKLFPRIKYIMFRRHAKDSKIKMLPIEKILRRKI